MLKKSSVKTKLHKKAVVKAAQEATVLGGDNSALGKCAALVKATAVKSMRMGGVTKGPRNGRRKIPSAPGTPPNVQTVDETAGLRASISFAVIANEFRALVGPQAFAWYGRVHEHGDSTHPQRPFMRPALQNASTRYKQFFKQLQLARTQTGRWLNSRKGAQ
jgi:hypothetical protein